MMNSFQAWMNAKIEVATRPGATSGRRIRTNAPKRVLPSTIAASSSSRGTPRMNPCSVHTENGNTNVMYITITPVSVLIRCTRLSAMYSGMIRAASGIISVPRISTMNAVRP